MKRAIDSEKLSDPQREVMEGTEVKSNNDLVMEMVDLRKAKQDADLREQEVFGRLAGIPLLYERVAALETMLATEKFHLEITKAQLADAEMRATKAEEQARRLTMDNVRVMKLVTVASQPDLDLQTASFFLSPPPSAMESPSTSARMIPRQAKRPASSSPDQRTDYAVATKRYRRTSVVSSPDVSILASMPFITSKDMPSITSDPQVLRSTALRIQARRLRQLLSASQQREQDTYNHSNILLTSLRAEFVILGDKHAEKESNLAQVQADRDALISQLAAAVAIGAQKDTQVADLERRLVDAGARHDKLLVNVAEHDAAQHAEHQKAVTLLKDSLGMAHNTLSTANDEYGRVQAELESMRLRLEQAELTVAALQAVESAMEDAAKHSVQQVLEVEGQLTEAWTRCAILESEIRMRIKESIVEGQQHVMELDLGRERPCARELIQRADELQDQLKQSIQQADHLRIHLSNTEVQLEPTSKELFEHVTAAEQASKTLDKEVEELVLRLARAEVANFRGSMLSSDPALKSTGMNDPTPVPPEGLWLVADLERRLGEAHHQLKRTEDDAQHYLKRAESDLTKARDEITHLQTQMDTIHAGYRTMMEDCRIQVDRSHETNAKLQQECDLRVVAALSQHAAPSQQEYHRSFEQFPKAILDIARLLARSASASISVSDDAAEHHSPRPIPFP
jgi:predicted  nucleic acid-binding Zn-ribbon protein